MDKTDFKILKILNKNSRRSYLSIGQELSVSGKSVQKRIEKMVNEGVILSFEVVYDSTLLGLSACIANLKIQSDVSKNEIIAEFKEIQNIYFVTCTSNNYLTILFYYNNRKDLENIISRIGSVNGALSIRTGIPRSRFSTDIKITPLDWKIIQSLNHNARKRNHEIAKEIGVSSRTIKRRLDRLIENKVIYFTLAVDTSKAVNNIIYLLSIELNIGVKWKGVFIEIERKYDTIWGVVKTVHSSIGLFMYANQLSQIDNVVESVKKIPEVKKAKALLFTSYHRFPEWVDEKLKKKTKN